MSNYSAQRSRGIAPSASFRWGVLAVWGILRHYLSNCSAQRSRGLAPSASFHWGVLAVWGILRQYLSNCSAQRSRRLAPSASFHWGVDCGRTWCRLRRVHRSSIAAHLLECREQTMQICVGFTTKQKRIERAILSLTSSDMNFDLLWVNRNKCARGQICVNVNMCWLYD